MLFECENLPGTGKEAGWIDGSSGLLLLKILRYTLYPFSLIVPREIVPTWHHEWKQTRIPSQKGDFDRKVNQRWGGIAILSWYPIRYTPGIGLCTKKTKSPRKNQRRVNVEWLNKPLCFFWMVPSKADSNQSREKHLNTVCYSLSIEYRIHTHYIPSRFEEKKKKVKGYSVVDHPCGRTPLIVVLVSNVTLSVLGQIYK